ncbi:UDP-3-O-[3-hydroxymyristoyl] glucosamine N-acyltransferase [hydrothermal vent metagenome]|uniref:UDP-3-O-[3-hydroxymyristoyl] glucosamine N-acyltransferase n=1 Tax=hydrothermal vent metagenome TaxID=652676 RepID=A0A3B0X3I1_9ZZZZ
MGYTLKQLADHLGEQVYGDESIVIQAVACIESAVESDISFVYSSKYISKLRNTKAGAVIIKREMLKEAKVASIVSDNPRAAYAKIVSLLYPQEYPQASIHTSANIHATANVAKTAHIGANVVIEADADIADNVIIEAGCVIGRSSRIGPFTRLYPNVTIYNNCFLGEHCILHSSSVIGSDGFGFEFYQNKWLKIPQVGGVRIGNHVEIGACSVVDRGALKDTIIENGVKLDNHVQIAHNAYVGAHTVMSRGVGIAGSTKIGKNCMIGGMAGIRDNVEIADNVIITAMSFVTKSIKTAGSYSSTTPIDETVSWRKNSVRFKQLDIMAKQIRKLEKQIQKKG